MDFLINCPEVTMGCCLDLGGGGLGHNWQLSGLLLDL